MPGGKVIYVLVDRRTKQMLRHANDKPAVYSSIELARSHVQDWGNSYGKGEALATVVELEVSNNFRFYRKERHNDKR
jgi:hypothetical protein